MSLFGQLFADSARDSLMHHLSETTVPVKYTMGTTVIDGIQGIIRHQSKHSQEDPDGNRYIVHKCELIVCRAEASEWKGVADPQVGAFWEFLGYRWRVDDQPDQAVGSISDTFVAVLLRRLEPIGKGTPEIRQRTP